MGELNHYKIFRELQEVSKNYGFVGGFPSFTHYGDKYEGIFINKECGYSSTITRPSNYYDYSQHFRDIDAGVHHGDFLSAFPTFKQYPYMEWGCVKINSNSGSRQLINGKEVGFSIEDTVFDRMKKTQIYAVSQGFGGGYPTFKVVGVNLEHELILLNNSSVTVKSFEYHDEKFG